MEVDANVSLVRYFFGRSLAALREIVLEIVFTTRALHDGREKNLGLVNLASNGFGIERFPHSLGYAGAVVKDKPNCRSPR